MSKQAKVSQKIVGYFSYTNAGQVFCDGDACIIASSKAKMKHYLEYLPTGNDRDIIKKTRFGEVLEGLRQGGAYAFDKKAYVLFVEYAKKNKISLPPWTEPATMSPKAVHFIRIQLLD